MRSILEAIRARPGRRAGCRARSHSAAALCVVAAVSACSAGEGPTEIEPVRSITLAVSPDSLTLAPGQGGDVQMTVQRPEGFEGEIWWRVEGSPAFDLGVRGLWDLESPGSVVTTTLALMTSASVEPGVYHLELRADGNGVRGDVARIVLSIERPPRLGWVSIGTGQTHTCGLTTEGRAYCWGDNSFGQLGTGDTLPRFTPAPVAGGLTFSEIAVGRDFNCGVTSEGRAYCWGRNLRGNLGDGTTQDRSVPTPVAGPTTFAQVVAGVDHACALTADGEPYCWGTGAGAWSDGTPQAVPGGVTFASLSAGLYANCGVAGDGRTLCWGAVFWGIPGVQSDVRSPTPLGVDDGFTGIWVGEAYACAVDGQGQGYCWGNANHLQAGDGGGSSLDPRPVPGGRTFASMSVSAQRICGLGTDGRVYCWAGNFDVGAPAGDEDEPVAIGGDPDRRYAYLGPMSTSGHTCAIGTDGGAYCWGRGGHGQLGWGIPRDMSGPVPVADPPATADPGAG